MNRTGRTNQVIYFARLNLQQANEAGGLQDKQMFEETVLHHLYSAVMSLTGELVQQYNLEPFTDLDELLSRDALPSELYELSLIKSQSTSWLYNLLKQHQRMIFSGLVENNVNSGLITTQSDYCALFANYLNEIENLVQRMRVHYQEN
mgnify:FL=1